MKILKLVHCNIEVFMKKTKTKLHFRDVVNEITLDSISNYNESNKFLCEISVNISSDLPSPKMFFLSSLSNTIYSLEFISGTEEVILGELHFDCLNDKIREPYAYQLIQDSNRIWNITKLTYDSPEEGEKLTNQVLSLLRICKIDKDEYLKNKDILSQKFTR